MEPWEAGLFLNLPLEKADRTLSLWRTRKKGPPYVVFGGLVRYRKSDLIRWVETQTVDPSKGDTRTARVARPRARKAAPAPVDVKRGRPLAAAKKRAAR
jgi:hypothetical protein